MMLYVKGDLAIGVMNLIPMRKKPCLVVREGNTITKVASFNSKETADWFMERFGKFIGCEEASE